MKTDLQDQRVRITKMMIRDAFLHLLRQKPLNKITVRELCEQAQINRGTFYTHYMDVYDLMEQTTNELLAEFRTALSALSEHANTLKSNYDICKAVFTILKNNQQLCVILLSDYSNKYIIDKFNEMGKKLFLDVYTSLFPKASQQKLENYYLFISGGCIALLRNWLINDDGNTTIDDIALQASQIMTDGSKYIFQ